MDDAREPTVIRVPQAVTWIVSTLEEAGYETWTVGGAVRDAVLQRPSGDWDLATRAEPATVRRLFKRTVPVGIEHGTVGVLARDGTMYEVTTFRRDVETFGRHAVVAFAETVLEDLERRDFTINALAWHPLREELLDPHGGEADLREGVLRTVGVPAERFAEDYLRVLRALRFAGRFDLRIHDETWAALTSATPHLTTLSPERVREELWKVLGGDAPPSLSLALYRRSGALRVMAPELDQIPVPLWQETLALVDHVSAARSELRMTALLGQVGAPPAQDDDPEAVSAEGAGAVARTDERLRAMARATAFLIRLRHSNARIATIGGLVGAGPELPGADASDEELRRWLARVGRARVPPILRWAIARHRVAAARGADAAPGTDPGPGRALSNHDLAALVRRLRAQLHAGCPLEVGDLAIGGRELIRMGLRPGPHFGAILDRLLDRVLTDPTSNDAETLLAWVREMEEADERSAAPGAGAHE